MAIKTYTTQLEEVQAALTVIRGGSQSYTVGDRTFTRGDLKALQDEEKYLRPLANRETRGGIRVRHATPANGR